MQIRLILLLAALLQISSAFASAPIVPNDNLSPGRLEEIKVSKEESLQIKTGLNSLASFQEKLDADTWQISKPEMAKLRHVSLHVTKVSGSLAEICEKWEHEVAKDANAVNNLENLKPEVLQDIIADLMMHAAQLSNLIGTSPYNALSQRVTRNIQRFAPDSKISLEK